MIPEYITIPATVVAAAGGCWGFYKAGIADAKSKNGYVKREDCHLHIDTMREDSKFMHEKINTVAQNVAKIMGRMGID